MTDSFGGDYPQRREPVPLEDWQIYKKLKRVSKHLSGDSGYVLRFDYTPVIRQPDIDNGRLTRYFARKTNDAVGEIIEVDEKLFNKLSPSSLYKTIKVEWRITGKIGDEYSSNIRMYTGVVSSNVLAALDADTQLRGMAGKLADPLQYYQKE